MADLRSNFWARIDWITLGIYLALVILGWVSIYSATFEEGQGFSLFNFSHRYGKQFLFILAALLIGVIILIIDSKFWAFFAYPVYGLMIFLLVLVLLIGDVINGAKSWIVLGPISIQPSEFAKFGTVLALSRLLSRFNFKLQAPKNLAIIALIIGLPAVLIYLQKDTGSAVVYLALLLVLFREGLNPTFLILGVIAVILFILTLIMPLLALVITITVMTAAFAAFWKRNFWYFVVAMLIPVSLYLAGMFGLKSAGLELPASSYIIISGFLTAMINLFIIYRKRLKRMYLLVLLWFGSLLFIGSVDFVFNEVLEAHQRSRINIVLGIESDPLGRGYNVNQSKIAIGSGGLFGKGFTKGPQTQYDFVPEQSTDFIFCTVGEEFGFLGSFVLVGLFTGLLLRMVYLSERQRSSFSRIFGYGVTSILLFHFVVNIGMTVGIVPVIGIPLPFFSYGGSSLWGFSILIFVFLKLDTDRFEVVG
jgi:rod shape determining protein RodA